jgi:hypothetical protein
LWTNIERVLGELGALLQLELERDPLVGGGHVGDLADLDAAVAHLATLVEATRGRQGRLDREAATEDLVDEPEVGRRDVDDAEGTQDDEGQQPRLHVAGHD